MENLRRSQTRATESDPRDSLRHPHAKDRTVNGLSTWCLRSDSRWSRCLRSRVQLAVDKPGVLGTRNSTVVASQLRACGVVCANAFPAHAMTREFTGEKPCAHVDVGARVVEVHFPDAVSSERRQVRAV